MKSDERTQGRRRGSPGGKGGPELGGGGGGGGGRPTRSNSNAPVSVGGPVDGGGEDESQSLLGRRIMKYFTNPEAWFGGEVTAVTRDLRGQRLGGHHLDRTPGLTPPARRPPPAASREHRLGPLQKAVSCVQLKGIKVLQAHSTAKSHPRSLKFSRSGAFASPVLGKQNC